MSVIAKLEKTQLHMLTLIDKLNIAVNKLKADNKALKVDNKALRTALAVAAPSP